MKESNRNPKTCKTKNELGGCFIMEGIVHVRGGRLSEQQVAETKEAHSDNAADSRIQDMVESRDRGRS